MLLYIRHFFAIIVGKVIKWMCIALKYGIWNVSEPKAEAVNNLVSAGYKPLCAMILAARNIDSGLAA